MIQSLTDLLLYPALTQNALSEEESHSLRISIYELMFVLV